MIALLLLSAEMVGCAGGKLTYFSHKVPGDLVRPTGSLLAQSSQVRKEYEEFEVLGPVPGDLSGTTFSIEVRDTAQVSTRARQRRIIACLVSRDVY